MVRSRRAHVAGKAKMSLIAFIGPNLGMDRFYILIERGLRSFLKLLIMGMHHSSLDN